MGIPIGVFTGSWARRYRGRRVADVQLRKRNGLDSSHDRIPDSCSLRRSCNGRSGVQRLPVVVSFEQNANVGRAEHYFISVYGWTQPPRIVTHVFCFQHGLGLGHGSNRITQDGNSGTCLEQPVLHYCRICWLGYPGIGDGIPRR